MMKVKKFSELKCNDYIYRIRVQIDNKPDDKDGSFKGLIFHAPEEYQDFRIDEYKIISVTPSIIYDYKHYMKMNGDNPYGVGTSVTETEDQLNVRVKYETNEIMCGFSVHVFNKNESSYISHDKKEFYFTNKKQAVTLYKQLINDHIEYLTNKISKLKELKKVSI